MSDLVEFLRERLNEDERVAQEARGESWSAQGEAHDMRRVTVDYSIEWVVACTLAPRGVHIARHDPARVLRDIEAKRRIVERAAFIGAAARPAADLAHSTEITSGAYRVLDDVLRLLALPHADHPDYRQEWKP